MPSSRASMLRLGPQEAQHQAQLLRGKALCAFSAKANELVGNEALVRHAQCAQAAMKCAFP